MEEIRVISSRDHRGVVHSVTADDRVVVDEITPHARTVAELISGISGVDLNGQGGALQTYSVRGTSRWRVQTRLGPALITTDRRAGNSASFLDPWLMNNVTIVKGPLSTLYGSGSIGGLVSIRPKEFSEPVLHSSLYSNGTDRKIGIGFGDDFISLGAVSQANQRSRDPHGDELNDKRRQAGLSIGLRNAERNSNLQLILTSGSDLGKSNLDFPDKRITEYPDEHHALLTWEKAWNNSDLSLYLHDQSLETEIQEPGQLISAMAESTEFGGLFQHFWQFNAFDLRAGFDLNGRADVKADESRINLDTGQTAYQDSLDGRQLVSALLTDLQWQKEYVILRGGLRWSDINQKNQGSTESDSNVVAFVGGSLQFHRWEFYTQAGNGFRFPELTEKFFLGTTSRGTVVGNTALDPEKSNSIEFGFEFDDEITSFRFAAYSTRLRDYIERIRIDEQRLTFNNNSSVKIRGFEMQFKRRFQNWHWDLNAHYIEGKNSREYIADIPAPAITIAMRYKLAEGSLSSRYRYRFSWDNVSPNETPVKQSHLLSVRYDRSLSSQTDISFWIDNALDESYRLTTDDQSALAPGIGIGISLLAVLR